MNSTLCTEKSLAAPINKSTYYNGIDLLKFLFSFFVVAIHITPFHTSNLLLNDYLNIGLQHYIARLAVPFYFVSSGFFLFKKMSLYEVDTQIIKNYCFRILRLYACWNIILFFGPKYHLWYLSATVVGVTLLSLCLYLRMNLKYIWLFAILFYLIGFTDDSYSKFLQPLKQIPVFEYISKAHNYMFDDTTNGFTVGFIFLLLGATIAHSKIRLKPLTAFIGLIVSMFALLIEVYFIYRKTEVLGHEIYLFLIPATFFLFTFATSFTLKNRPIYKHLRTIGILIYLSHLIIDSFVIVLIRIFNDKLNINMEPYRFFISLFFTVLFSIIVEYLSNKEKFSWIKSLFT